MLWVSVRAQKLVLSLSLSRPPFRFAAKTVTLCANSNRWISDFNILIVDRVFVFSDYGFFDVVISLFMHVDLFLMSYACGFLCCWGSCNWYYYMIFIGVLLMLLSFGFRGMCVWILF